VNENGNEISRTTIVKLFAALVVAALLLRIFYAGHLFEDDGLWFTAAQELLRGKALYREIYFDKPPILPLLYALLFKLFGAHILTIRLFAAVYSVAVAFVLYRFGALLYDRRAGLVAASLFVIGSTTYTTGQFQGFNTDCLMTLPYTLGAYWFVRSNIDSHLRKARSARLAFAAGLATGLALQTNPKAIFELLFFVLCAMLFVRRPAAVIRHRDDISPIANPVPPDSSAETNPKSKIQNPKFALYRLLLALVGCFAGALPFWIYIFATKSWSAYWSDVWQWGAHYAGYYSWKIVVTTALEQSLGYFLTNGVFFIGLSFVLVVTVRSLWRKSHKGTQSATGAGFTPSLGLQSDSLLLLWFAISYAAMSVGGRFFGHYFMQILPALCLLVARAFTDLIQIGEAQNQTGRLRRNILLALFAISFLFTLARYHTRTVILAVDWFSGTQSEMTKSWFYERAQRDDQQAAAIVKEGITEIEEREASGRQKSNTGKHREGEGALFVWGYRPEIYFWSGLAPASRYLSSQLLTGVPADVNYFGDNFMAVLDEPTTAAHRAELLKELQETRPQFIVDELAAYNSTLAMESYPELQDFLYDYKLMETDVKVFIYRLRNPKEKNKPTASN
jgi:4-amino-4-deoxy-L-arabinose transferase-like glycosyltransferase